MRKRRVGTQKKEPPINERAQSSLVEILSLETAPNDNVLDQLAKELGANDSVEAILESLKEKYKRPITELDRYTASLLVKAQEGNSAAIKAITAMLTDSKEI